ncbi:Uncharacterised protein [Serratia ficaria]|nr:Uncharacterised protein [Serratia ficaria]
MADTRRQGAIGNGFSLHNLLLVAYLACRRTGLNAKYALDTCHCTVNGGAVEQIADGERDTFCRQRPGHFAMRIPYESTDLTSGPP